MQRTAFPMLTTSERCQRNWDRHATVKWTRARVLEACSINISLISITSSDSQASRRQSDAALLHYFPIPNAIIIVRLKSVCSALFFLVVLKVCAQDEMSWALRDSSVEWIRNNSNNEAHFKRTLINCYAMFVSIGKGEEDTKAIIDSKWAPP